MPVYIGIIEIIGERLYTGRITWLREYIQNAIDAGANKVEISINDGNLEIEDDGSGMNASELGQEAFALGSSSKSPDQIGELGIGMYAGVGISSRVIVSTKKKEKQTFTATFDVQEYKRLKSVNSRMLFDNAIKQVFKVKEADDQSANQDDHFTRIRFEHLSPRAIQLLGKDKVIEFIQNNINVPISERFAWKEKVETFLGDEQKVIYVKLNIGGIVYEPRRFENVEEELNEPIMMPIGEKGGTPTARLWACYSKKGESFADRGAEILVKFKGMAVGDKTVVTSRFDAKDDGRYLGEIVVLKSCDLRINTERSWFTDSDELARLVENGKGVLQELHSLANTDSNIGNGVIRLVKRQTELNANIKKEEAKGNRGRVEELKEEHNEVSEKIEKKLEQRQLKIAELKEAVKTDSSPVKKAVYALLSSQPILKVLTPAKEEPKERRKRDNLQYIRTSLNNYVVDRRLAAVTQKKNMKDTTNNVFTLLESVMKAKLGIPESTLLDFKILLTQFMDRCRDSKEPIEAGQKSSHYEAFRNLMSSLHTVLRNPSAHTFMKDKDTDRNIMQVLLIGDFALNWLDCWSLKSPQKKVS